MDSEFQKFGAKSEPPRNIHIPGLPSCTLAETVAREIQDGARAQWLISFGAVYLNHIRQTDGSVPVIPTDIIRVHLDPKRYGVNRDDIRNRIVFENEDFVVVDKPSGLPMHPTLDNLQENLISAFDFKAYVTHRLDVPTSGLVVIAKTKTYQTLFNNLVARRELKKIYQAFVKTPPPRLGIWRHYMKVTDRAPKEVLGVEEVPEGDHENYDECLLEILSTVPYRSTKEMDGTGHLLTIELLTGRTHQIRAQLSKIGSPILGDELYGGTPAREFGLHAAKIQFICPKSLKLHSFERWRIF